MAEEASIEDRVADAVLGSDDEDLTDDQPEAVPEDSGEEIEASSETGEAEDKPETFEVELEGQLYEVPKAIHDEIQKAQDYTKKTQSVAAERKQYEALRATVEQAQKQYEFMGSIANEATQVQTLDMQIQQATQYLKEHFDDLTDKQILQLRLNIDEARQQKETLQQSLSQKYQEYQQAQEQSRGELLAKSTEVLRSRIPNWEKAKDEVAAFVRESGFTDQDLASAMLDPRQMQMAHDAMKYRQLKDKTGAAVKKVETAIKPKARDPMPEDVKKRLNLRKQIKSAKSPRDRERLIQEDVATRLGL